MSLLLTALLAAAPCTRVAVTPFEPIATSPAEARAVEQAVRAELAARPGVCVEARAQTVAKLAAFPGHRLPPCADAACTARHLEALGAEELISGLVVGAGARRSVALTRGTVARTARTTADAGDAAALHGALGVLFQWDTAAREAPTRWPAYALAAASLASAGAGVALGVQARATETALSTASTGCAPGAGFAPCLDGQLRAGQGQATAANVLFGVAGALAAGAVVWWVVEWP